MHFRKSPPWFRAAFVDLTCMRSPVCGEWDIHVYIYVQGCQILSKKSGLNNSYFDRSARNHSKAIHASFKAKRKKKGVKNGNNIADGQAFGFFFHLLFVFCAHAKCRLVHVLQRQSDRGRTTRRGIMSLTAVRGGFFLSFLFFTFKVSAHVHRTACLFCRQQHFNADISAARCEPFADLHRCMQNK